MRTYQNRYKTLRRIKANRVELVYDALLDTTNKASSIVNGLPTFYEKVSEDLRISNYPDAAKEIRLSLRAAHVAGEMMLKNLREAIKYFEENIPYQE